MQNTLHISSVVNTTATTVIQSAVHCMASHPLKDPKISGYLVPSQHCTWDLAREQTTPGVGLHSWIAKLKTTYTHAHTYIALHILLCFLPPLYSLPCPPLKVTTGLMSVRLCVWLKCVGLCRVWMYFFLAWHFSVFKHGEEATPLLPYMNHGIVV